MMFAICSVVYALVCMMGSRGLSPVSGFDELNVCNVSLPSDIMLLTDFKQHVQSEFFTHVASQGTATNLLDIVQGSISLFTSYSIGVKITLNDWAGDTGRVFVPTPVNTTYSVFKTVVTNTNDQDGWTAILFSDRPQLYYFLLYCQHMDEDRKCCIGDYGLFLNFKDSSPNIADLFNAFKYLGEEHVISFDPVN